MAVITAATVRTDSPRSFTVKQQKVQHPALRGFVRVTTQFEQVSSELSRVTRSAFPAAFYTGVCS